MYVRNDKTNKKVSFDESLLQDISFIDVRSAFDYLRSLVQPMSKGDRKTPYTPIRKFSLFFDAERGVLRHGPKGSREFYDFMLGDESKVSKYIRGVVNNDSNVVRMLYDYEARNVDRLHIEKVTMLINDSLENVKGIIRNLDTSDTSYFGRKYLDTEFWLGSKDGRRVGLEKVILNANASTRKLGEICSKLRKLMKKGEDPLSERYSNMYYRLRR